MPPLIDLTGKKFGYLLVIKRHELNDIRNKPQWICKCQCGKEIIVAGSHLRSGHTKSCGCSTHKHSGDLNFKDISNQKFGKLTALYHSRSNAQGSAMWLCQCECGNHVEVRGMDLRNGHTKSCGCLLSLGESKVQQLLELNNIPFEKQKMFETCRFINTNQMARFDFWINSEYLIEYDGIQHFEAVGWGDDVESAFLQLQERDVMKNQWCQDNNIPLIRIPYFIYNELKIEDLLLETTKYRVV